uniref:Polynucleotide adenylyltransferase n=1 Tax=Steinernema glaseri TaxID=37863 RepID=A0A1I8AG91_9BILA
MSASRRLSSPSQALAPRATHRAVRKGNQLQPVLYAGQKNVDPVVIRTRLDRFISKILVSWIGNVSN